jgi:dipeptidase E
MTKTNILAISSSRVGNSAYLEKAIPLIEDFLGNKPLNIAFIPFASADGNYSGYEGMVSEALKGLPYSIKAVVQETAVNTLENADVIMVGGGNTFKLLHDIYDLQLMDFIKEKVIKGTPYIGWSAGANITGLTIGTTNDMPIIEPQSFKALGFFPFQINPHYHNVVTEGFNGETRNQRLEEYLKVNPGKAIIGLPEGTALQLKKNILLYKGLQPAIMFIMEKQKLFTSKEIMNDDDLSYLML